MTHSCTTNWVILNNCFHVLVWVIFSPHIFVSWRNLNKGHSVCNHSPSDYRKIGMPRKVTFTWETLSPWSMSVCLNSCPFPLHGESMACQQKGRKLPLKICPHAPSEGRAGYGAPPASQGFERCGTESAPTDCCRALLFPTQSQCMNSCGLTKGQFGNGCAVCLASSLQVWLRTETSLTLCPRAWPPS